MKSRENGLEPGCLSVDAIMGPTCRNQMAKSFIVPVSSASQSAELQVRRAVQASEDKGLPLFRIEDLN